MVLKIFFINFGCLGSSLLCGLCLVVASGGCSLVVVLRLLIAVTSLVAEHGLETCRRQQLWLPGSIAQAQ